MIISNIKCPLRDNLFGKIKTSQQNTTQKAALKNFAIFTGKHLFLFNKVAAAESNIVVFLLRFPNS